jgi:2-keto-4-pentenoate hydratase
MPLPWDDPRIMRGMAAQLDARRKRIADGDKPLGWKVGFGAPAIMEKFRITAPLVGYLMQSGRVSSGDSVSLNGWTKPAAEPEIAVRIGRDLSAGGDLAAATRAITALSPAIELADVDLPFEDPEAILKQNIFQRHVVLGPPEFARDGSSTAGLAGTLFSDGKEIGHTDDPEALTGKLAVIVRHVADLLGACGEKLSAGDIIIAGSVTPPLIVDAAAQSVAFQLDPIGRISVNFTR